MTHKIFEKIIFAKDKWIDWIFTLDFEIIFFQGKVKERAKESKKILIKEWYNIVFCMKKVRV